MEMFTLERVVSALLLHFFASLYHTSISAVTVRFLRRNILHVLVADLKAILVTKLKERFNFPQLSQLRLTDRLGMQSEQDAPRREETQFRLSIER
jgi:cell division protein FtsB